MNKTEFVTSTFSPHQFTSSWYYLSDETNTQCWGEITIKDQAIECLSNERMISLHILLEIDGFGKIMVKTALVGKGTHDLLNLLIDGRTEQIKTYIDKYEGVQGFEKKLVKVLTVKNKHKKLSLLFQLGEEIVVFGSEKILSEKIANGEMRDFLIGAQAFGIRKGKQYKKIHQQNFDLGIVPFYFFLVHPKSKDEFDWSLTDEIIDWLGHTKRPIKGHPLVWLHTASIPEWMRALTFEELKEFIKEHVTKAILRYKNRIKMWDIVNEIPTQDANSFNLTNDQLIEITKLTSDLVHELDPYAERIVNISDIFGPKSYIHDVPSIPPIHSLELFKKNNIEYESIGLQFYMGMRKEFACRELMDLSMTIDEFTKFGKPIHISELGWPSLHDVDPDCFFSADHPEVAGRWHRGWDEELQAAFIKRTYALFASKPKVKSITWWDITDNGIHEDIGSRFIPFSGLTRRDFSPKPALLEIAKFRKYIKS